MHTNKLDIVRIDYQRDIEHHEPNAISKKGQSKKEEVRSSATRSTTTSDITRNRRDSLQAFKILQTDTEQKSDANIERNIYIAQNLSHIVHVVGTWISATSLLCGIAIVVIFCYKSGQMQSITIWESFNIVVDIALMIYSTKYKKIRINHMKVSKIYLRIKFHVVMNLILLSIIAFLFISYGPRQIFTMAFMSVSLDDPATYSIVVNSRGSLFIITMGAVRILIGVACIVLNMVYYKNACRLNIREFIKTTKERISIQ